MTIEKTQTIKELEKLEEKGELYLALDKIEEIVKSKETTKVEKIQAKLKKCRILYWMGGMESIRDVLREAQKIATELLQECEESGETELIFDVLVWYNWYLWAFSKTKEFVEGVKRQEELFQQIEEEGCLRLREKKANLLALKGNVGLARAMYDTEYKWNNQETIDFLKEGLEESMKTDNKIVQIICAAQLGGMYDIIANYDKSIEAYTKAIEISEEMGNDYFTSAFLSQIGVEYACKGDFETFVEYVKKALELKERIGNERFKASSYGQIGAYYEMRGELKEALEYTTKARNILTENGKKENPGWLWNISTINYKLGETDKALEYAEELYRIQKKDKRELASIYTLSYIAVLYFRKGKLDKALELRMQCLDFFERTGNKQHVAWDYITIGLIYEKKGLIDKALDYLEQGLDLLLELDNKNNIAWALYKFVIFTAKYNMMDLARDYYSKLEKIIEDIELKNIKRLVLVAEGIILRSSEESRDRDRAEILFDQLLQEDLDTDLYIEVLLQMCELLLTELKETSNERYLSKLHKYVGKLVEKGTEANLPEVIIESLWFKSQLSLLKLDVDKARELLTQALDLAERKGYNKLALKITNSKEKLIKQKIELDNLEKESPSISKRMEIVRVENGFKEMKQKEVFEFNIDKVDSSKKLFSIKI